MPFNVGAIVSELKLDTREFTAGIRRSGDQARSFGDRMRAVSADVRRVGAAMLAVGMAIKGTGLLMIKLAADAEESENLFVVSMGNMADATRAWSEEFQEALGVNAYEVRRMAGTFNVMFKSMGMAEDSAYGMSRGLTQLTYDMASFYNMSNSDAFQKLQSGISGEIEPLRRLGITVDENTVKTWALTNGFIKQGEEMTQLQKVYARYQVIIEQTKIAQGDLERTSDSLTNQWRRLQGQAKTLGIEIGNFLIPGVTDLVGEINIYLKAGVAWVRNNEELARTLVLAVAQVGTMTTALGGAAFLLPNLVSGFALMGRAAFSSAMLAGSGLKKLLLNPLVALAGLTYTLRAAWNQNFNGMRESTVELGRILSESFHGAFMAIGASVDWLVQNWQAMVNAMIGTFVFFVKAVGLYFERMVDGLVSGMGRVKDVSLEAARYLNPKNLFSAQSRAEIAGNIKGIFEDSRGEMRDWGAEIGDIQREAYTTDYLAGAVAKLKDFGSFMKDFYQGAAADVVELGGMVKDQIKADVAGAEINLDLTSPIKKARAELEAYLQEARGASAALPDVYGASIAAPAASGIAAEKSAQKLRDQRRKAEWSIVQDLQDSANEYLTIGTQRIDEQAKAWREMGVDASMVSRWVQQEQTDLWMESAKQGDSFFEGAKAGWKEFSQSAKTSGEAGYQAAVKAASAMESAFGSFIENSLSDAKNYRDHLLDLFRDIQRAWSRMIADMIVDEMKLAWKNRDGAGGGGGAGWLGTAIGAIGSIFTGGASANSGSFGSPVGGGMAQAPILNRAAAVGQDTAKASSGDANLVIYNLVTTEAVAGAMASRAGEGVVVNIIRNNQANNGPLRQTIKKGR